MLWWKVLWFGVQSLRWMIIVDYIVSLKKSIVSINVWHNCNKTRSLSSDFIWLTKYFFSLLLSIIALVIYVDMK